MRQEIIIEAMAPNLNEVLNSAKRHWGAYYGQKKKWNSYVVSYCKLFKLQPMETPIKLTIEQIYPDKRRRDIDNTVIKFFCDAIVEAGIIPDDSSEYIDSIVLSHPNYEKGKKQTRIILESLHENKNSD